MRDNPIRVSEARALTPPVDPVEAMRRQAAVAAFGAVTEADVEQLVQKLKELALSGDHRAIKMYFELIGVMGGKPATQAQAAESGAIRLMAQALQDLVDEIRVTRARSQRPALESEE